MQLSLSLSDPLWIFHINKFFKEKIQKEEVICLRRDFTS